MNFKLRRFLTKYRLIIIPVVILGILTLWVALAQPFIARYVVFRLFSKAFTSYEINHLKYPNSDLVMTEVKPTTKITMARYYTYYTTDDIKTVLDLMEKKLPGFVQMKGSYIKVKPTFINKIGANGTKFKSIFQVIGYSTPYIEVNMYPSTKGGTSIQISEHWLSMGIPSCLRWL